MPTDLIRYDLQVQDALRGVVRKVLADAARDGLPGEHHFYVTFRTDSPGARLSSRLREQYPDEMTIILQYQFWDLRVEQAGFEVGLHFKNIPERLYVPFDAISGFYDPSVQFGLKFEAQTEGEDETEEEEEDELILGPVANRPRPTPAASPAAPADKPKEPDAAKAAARRPTEPQTSPVKTPSEKQNASEEKKAPPATPAVAGEESKVVSIDAFRKKP